MRTDRKKCQRSGSGIGVDATVDKVTDVMEIAKYGVFGTPAVVVDGKVKSVGKIPDKSEIKTWIGK